MIVKESNENNLAAIEPLEEETQKAVELLGRVIHSASIYGMEHRATAESMRQAYEICSAVVDSRRRINFSIKDNQLLVDGRLPDNSRALIKQLARKMIAKRITAFSIVKGMQFDEFSKLIELLSGSDESDFDDQLKASNLRHVSSEKVVYQEVSEDQEVASKSGRDSASGDIRDLAEQWLAGNADESEGVEGGGSASSSAGVEQIVAFLKGDVAPDDPALQEELSRAAEDPEKLAQLIMEASVIRQSQTDVQSGESVADLVIGCLRRTYEGIRKKSQKRDDQGGLDLKKSFMLLEKNIIDKLHRITGSSDSSIDSEIREAIKAMGDDLEMNSIASEYMEQRANLARNEKRIAEYIKSQSGGTMEQHLLNAGMPPETWHNLVARSSAQAGSGGGGPGSGAGDIASSFGALAVVLSKFDELMSSTTPSASEVESMIDQIEGHVETAEENTLRKIDQFTEEVQQEIGDRELGLGDAEQRQIRAHRKQFSIFVERLAELAQELLQPLTVINCSINMTLSGYIGEVSDEQKDLLSLAQSNANRLNRLIDRLTKLVGYPKDLDPKAVEAES